ncbi:hypothetical protein KEM54_003023, partial [Ascosphaera aggregata]
MSSLLVVEDMQGSIDTPGKNELMSCNVDPGIIADLSDSIAVRDLQPVASKNGLSLEGKGTKVIEPGDRKRWF